MRGLKSEDLVAMIDFLYFGEANVYQENLDSILAVAEELQLKGLMGSAAEEEVEDVNKKPMVKKKAKHREQQKGYPKQDTTTPENLHFVAKVETSPPQEGTIAVTDYTVAADLQDLDSKIKSMMETTHRTMVVGNRNRAVIVCKVCVKEGQMGDIQKHIEAHHTTGGSHTCNICGKISSSRNGLATHKSIKHNYTRNRCLRCIQPASKIYSEACA